LNSAVHTVTTVCLDNPWNSLKFSQVPDLNFAASFCLLQYHIPNLRVWTPANVEDLDQELYSDFTIQIHLLSVFILKIRIFKAYGTT